jgi:hypothetical protein
MAVSKRYRVLSWSSWDWKGLDAYALRRNVDRATTLSISAKQDFLDSAAEAILRLMSGDLS